VRGTGVAVTQHGDEQRVDLDGDEAFGARDEQVGHRAASRPDLDDGLARVRVERVDDALEGASVGEEVLSEALAGGGEPVARGAIAHDGLVAALAARDEQGEVVAADGVADVRTQGVEDRLDDARRRLGPRVADEVEHHLLTQSHVEPAARVGDAIGEEEEEVLTRDPGALDRRGVARAHA
jgi:hypothetical protein